MRHLTPCLILLGIVSGSWADQKDSVFFESKIRPLLVKHCYECHSEKAQAAEGGLLLDRRSGWLEGGSSGKAVLPGNPDRSLLIQAVRHTQDLAMPPESKLADAEIGLLVEWVKRGAPGPRADLGETEFSRLGDQDYLFGKAAKHWAFAPVKPTLPPEVDNARWNKHPIDRFVYAQLKSKGLTPSPRAPIQVLLRRLSFDLTGLPPDSGVIAKATAAGDKGQGSALQSAIDAWIHSPAYGEHVARMWLDVARYADTDSFYRPDTRTPHYFPFAFTYRDYVVAAYTNDKPIDAFITEQLAADLIEPAVDPKTRAALGFLAVGPFANRNAAESLDDWIDVTTRGLMGITAACARCHDHKYEPIPTQDYYALRGIFASTTRIKPLDERLQPMVPGYEASKADRDDYEKKRAAIDKKMKAAGNKKQKNNNRSVATKIKETELAELLLFHSGAPARAMTVVDKKRPVRQFVFLRGDPRNRGPEVPRRFLKVLAPEQEAFSQDSSGRLELAQQITSPTNPLTARVYVNRVWGMLMGSYLVATPSDFGLQGAKPTHPKLLDWLANDFMQHGWSTRHLIRTIVTSQTYQQSSILRKSMAEADPQNWQLWRANRKHLSIESIRDSMLFVAGQLERTSGGRASKLWGPEYTKRRSIYGYINRFNLDPTLRAFDFPTPMQSQASRGESIVAPQALFTMNSPFVIDQSKSIVNSETFQSLDNDASRIKYLFETIYQRAPLVAEANRCRGFLGQQKKFQARKKAVPGWSLLAHAMLMSNEFQYID